MINEMGQLWIIKDILEKDTGDKLDRIIALLEEIVKRQEADGFDIPATIEPLCSCICTGSGEVVKISEDCSVHWNCYNGLTQGGKHED